MVNSSLAHSVRLAVIKRNSSELEVQLSERMLGAVIVSVAVKAMPPVATITVIGDRKERVRVYIEGTEFKCATDRIDLFSFSLVPRQ